jgi:hypothetical protein
MPCRQQIAVLRGFLPHDRGARLLSRRLKVLRIRIRRCAPSGLFAAEATPGHRPDTQTSALTHWHTGPETRGPSSPWLASHRAAWTALHRADHSRHLKLTSINAHRPSGRKRS